MALSIMYIYSVNAVCIDSGFLNYITQISLTTSRASVKNPAPAAVTADVQSPESERHYINRNEHTMRARQIILDAASSANFAICTSGCCHATWASLRNKY